MNTTEDMAEEYDSYLGRMRQFRPQQQPLDFEAFKQAYQRWDREYDAAVRDGNHSRLLELEELLCV